MPNRIIKESICTSKDIDQLKPEEEIFFYRIIVNCDDYGRMEADPVILRAKCFPRRTDTIKVVTIEKWLYTLIDATLATLYRIEDKIYIQLLGWDKHQQIRANKSKFPSMDDEGAQIIELDSNGNQMKSDEIRCPRNRTRNRESKAYSESGKVEAVPYEQIVDNYHTECQELPKVVKLTKTRKEHLNARWQELKTLDAFCTLFRRVHASDFLNNRSGENRNSWRCDFDWLIESETNPVKVMEGKYDNVKPGDKPPPEQTEWVQVTNLDGTQAMKPVTRRPIP